MRAKAVRQSQTDPALLTALALATAAALVALLAYDAGPAAFVPVGVVALPLAGSRKSALALRIVAALALGLLIASMGVRTGLLFAPSALALLYSAARLAQPRTRARRGR